MASERRLYRVPATAAMGVVLCAALASPALAGEWSASAGWGLRLDDHRVIANVAGEPPARIAPWTQALLPALSLSGEPLGARIGVDARGRLEFGSSVPGEGAGALRSGSSGEASATLTRSFGSLFDLEAGALAARSRDLLDVDQATVSADGDATRWGGSARADSRWLEGEWRVRGWHSETMPPSDTRSLTWGARAFLERSAAGAWYLGGHERRMDRDGASALRAGMAAIGVRRNVGPGLGVTFELGAVQEWIGPERQATRPAASIELGNPRDDGRATQVRLRVARELGNEFEAELSRRAGRATAWARASSLVDIEGSDAGGPAVIQRAALGAGDTLAAATVLAFEVSVARNRSYRGLPLEPVSAVRLGAWVERRMQPWLSCRAGWDILRRDATGPDGTTGFRRSRFEIQLKANAR